MQSASKYEPMWVAQNYTPFAVARGFACDREGRKHWIVAVRATFVVGDDGRLVRVRDQPPVSVAATFRGDPATSSLLYDSDLLLTKAASDVIVDGQAWAPGGRPAEAVDVGLRIGTIRKILRIHGERVWSRAAGAGALIPSRAKPFLNIPITYERAFGGQDPDGSGYFPLNPVGRGYANTSSRLLGTLAPNVEDPSDPMSDSAHRPRAAAGFGALPVHWGQRVRFAGTYDAEWQRERAPLWPQDLDLRFFQVAPSDQQVQGFLRGGESCVLLNLTPQGSLRFTLPKLQISVTTQFQHCERQQYAQLHTLLLRPDERRLTMVWHSGLECHGQDHLLQRSLVHLTGERAWTETRPST